MWIIWMMYVELLSLFIIFLVFFHFVHNFIRLMLSIFFFSIFCRTRTVLPLWAPFLLFLWWGRSRLCFFGLCWWRPWLRLFLLYLFSRWWWPGTRSWLRFWLRFPGRMWSSGWARPAACAATLWRPWVRSASWSRSALSPMWTGSWPGPASRTAANFFHFQADSTSKEFGVMKFSQCILHIIFRTKLDNSAKTKLNCQRSFVSIGSGYKSTCPSLKHKHMLLITHI